MRFHFAAVNICYKIRMKNWNTNMNEAIRQSVDNRFDAAEIEMMTV